MRPLPMLAVAGPPFDSAAHLFEVKWDGIRALAGVEGSRWALWGRGGVEYTARYPELAVLGRLPADTVVDGELVALRGGRADFRALLSRHQRCPPPLWGDPALPVCYLLFDLLYLRGRACMHEALVERRARLRELLEQVREPVLAFSDGVVGNGREFYKRVVAQGHEGVMAKQQGSRYRAGRRSPVWRKIKPNGQLPCVIVGYRAGRAGVERLFVAGVRDGVLRYVGQVRRGLDARCRAELARRLASRPRLQPVVSCPEPACWVEPEWYCRVQFVGWTSHGHLRHAVFDGLLESP
jgi:bifunctional non-homologous end joining protein LigD